MRQLLPSTRDGFDRLEIVSRENHPTGSGRPWVMANMVMSADGAYASSGTSRAISSDADREMFHLLRTAADVILVGAGTARAERYRRPTTPDELATIRSGLGIAPVPRLAVISASGLFPDDQPFLNGEGPDPVVFTPADSLIEGTFQSIELRRTEGHDVSVSEVLASLYDDGARVVLCEGGPHLLGQLVAQDLLDELFLTLAPVLVGGERTGLLGGVRELHQEMTLHRLVESDGHLLLTYRRSPD